ncbi:hypothetical protein [Bartonella grahamii]|nr:hypothetical protein [Bartonella grahamii]
MELSEGIVAQQGGGWGDVGAGLVGIGVGDYGCFGSGWGEGWGGWIV